MPEGAAGDKVRGRIPAPRPKAPAPAARRRGAPALLPDPQQARRLRIAHRVFGAVLVVTVLVTGSLVSDQFEATLPLVDLAHNPKVPNATEPKGAVSPTVVLVVADDLGFNDFGFASSDLNKCTPALDRMRAEGIELTNLHTAKTCTASRAALLTATYPEHLGLQHGELGAAEPWSLPLSSRTLAQSLRDAGYWTVLVGKWHLGHYVRQATPTYRGFDEFFGYYTNARDYVTRVAQGACDGKGTCFFDAVDGDFLFGPDGKLRHSTYTLADAATKHSREHALKRDSPLFLMLSLPNSHAPLVVPPYEYVKHADILRHIPNRDRRAYAALTLMWDEALKNVSDAVEVNLAPTRPTLYVVLSSNGAAPWAGGSNWPLRGGKGSAFEGGVHVRGVVYSPSHRLVHAHARGSSYEKLVHLVDIAPTILGFAGHFKLLEADGLDLSAPLNGSADALHPHRTEALISLDYLTEDLEYPGFVKGAMLSFDGHGTLWKVMVHADELTDWYRVPAAEVSRTPPPPRANKGLGTDALYNLTADPIEEYNLADVHPAVFDRLRTSLVETYMPMLRRAAALAPDPAALAVWKERSRFVGPWRDAALGEAQICELTKPSRLKYELDQGLINCSVELRARLVDPTLADAPQTHLRHHRGDD